MHYKYYLKDITSGETHQLFQDSVIGRGSQCDIKIAHNTVSRRHATIVFIRKNSRNICRITDGWRGTPSSYGVCVNDKKVQACDLEPGDIIQLGKVKLELLVVQNDISCVYEVEKSTMGIDNSDSS